MRNFECFLVFGVLYFATYFKSSHSSYDSGCGELCGDGEVVSAADLLTNPMQNNYFGVIGTVKRYQTEIDNPETRARKRRRRVPKYRPRRRPPVQGGPSPNTGNSTKAPVAAVEKCTDGSGMLCIPSGTCVSHLKSTAKKANLCSAGKECCMGEPLKDKSCKAYNGQCEKKASCGSVPRFMEANDCGEGKICCLPINAKH